MLKTLTARHFIVPLVYYFSLSFGLLFISSYWLINGSGEIAKSNAQENFQNEYDFEIRLNPTNPIENEEKEAIIIQIASIDPLCDDPVAKKIDAFFEERNTPLKDYGCVFLKEAKMNGLNPYLLPAIAQKESSGGKITPQFGGGESYNAWGWAVFDNSDVTKTVNGYASESWEIFIGRVARGIKGKADKKGLTTSPEDVAVWYNPGSVRTAGGDPDLSHWTKSVSTFMKMIEETEI